MPQPGIESPAETALSAAEHCAGVVSRALLQGEPAAIESATQELQQASLSLSYLLRTPGAALVLDRHFRQRLGKVVQNMAMQREALLRRTAVVERSLHSLVPATRAPTYAGGVAPYGHNARQSGAFKLLAA